MAVWLLWRAVLWLGSALACAHALRPPAPAALGPEVGGWQLSISRTVGTPLPTLCLGAQSFVVDGVGAADGKVYVINDRGVVVEQVGFTLEGMVWWARTDDPVVVGTKMFVPFSASVDRDVSLTVLAFDTASHKVPWTTTLALKCFTNLAVATNPTPLLLVAGNTDCSSKAATLFFLDPGSGRTLSRVALPSLFNFVGVAGDDVVLWSDDGGFAKVSGGKVVWFTHPLGNGDGDGGGGGNGDRDARLGAEREVVDEAVVVNDRWMVGTTNNTRALFAVDLDSGGLGPVLALNGTAVGLKANDLADGGVFVNTGNSVLRVNISLLSDDDHNASSSASYGLFVDWQSQPFADASTWALPMAQSGQSLLYVPANITTNNYTPPDNYYGFVLDIKSGQPIGLGFAMSLHGAQLSSLMWCDADTVLEFGGLLDRSERWHVAAQQPH